MTALDEFRLGNSRFTKSVSYVGQFMLYFCQPSVVPEIRLEGSDSWFFVAPFMITTTDKKNVCH